MDPVEALSLIAAVSVGLAGFAGVAVVLRRAHGQWNPADGLRIRLLLSAAFGSLFVSLFPIGLASAGVSSLVAVRFGSAILFVFAALWLIGAYLTIRRLDPQTRSVFSLPLGLVIVAFGITVEIAQVLSFTGIAGAASHGLLFFGLVAFLGYAALGFIRLMFIRPPTD